MCGRKKRGVLFLPYKAGEIAALRAIISAWMSIAIFEAMGRIEGDQRLWFIVDELDALGGIDGLKDALSRLRKFGGRCVLALQSMAWALVAYDATYTDWRDELGEYSRLLGSLARSQATLASPRLTSVTRCDFLAS